MKYKISHKWGKDETIKYVGNFTYDRSGDHTLDWSWWPSIENADKISLIFALTVIKIGTLEMESFSHPKIYIVEDK